MNDFLDDMVQAYLACAWWADCPESMQHTIKEPTKATKLAAIEDCRDFMAKASTQGIDVQQFNADQVGHDFWLTRNGHGTGFWDREDTYGGELAADILTDVAKSFGDAYVHNVGKYFVIE